MEYKRKKIDGYDNYEIDNVGNVYSLKKGFNGKNADGKLSNRVVSQGYHQVSLYATPNKPKQLLVHRLVWEAFNGPIPEDMTIDHIDNDKTNNILSNLQLMTRTDNLKKMWDHRGRSQKKDVVRDWLARGYSRKFISENLDVSQGYISLISTGKR